MIQWIVNIWILTGSKACNFPNIMDFIKQWTVLQSNITWSDITYTWSMTLIWVKIFCPNMNTWFTNMWRWSIRYHILYLLGGIRNLWSVPLSQLSSSSAPSQSAYPSHWYLAGTHLLSPQVNCFSGWHLPVIHITSLGLFRMRLNC